MMLGGLKSVVVIGGSYVGLAAVKELAMTLPATHRVILVEPHSHFHHLFAFPRFAVVPSYEHKAFIPYSTVFSGAPNPASHLVIKAKVVSLQPDHVVLDRDWHGTRQIPFEFVVVTSGTRLPAPGTMLHDDKLPSVEYFKSYQQRVKRASSIVIVGGGAVGVQMATDLKDIYPQKDVTVVHSRDRLMPLYHPRFDKIVRERFAELGVNLITGTRAVVPEGGFPSDGDPYELELEDGRKVVTELVILATGQIPNNQFVQTLPTTNKTTIINPTNGFIRVKPTLQFQDPAYPNFYAAGDIADSGVHKAARPGVGQAMVVAKNILAMIQGQQPTEEFAISPPGIHISLGVKKHMIFRNPNTDDGETEPIVKWGEDGKLDMGISSVWQRRGVEVTKPEDYHL